MVTTGRFSQVVSVTLSGETSPPPGEASCGDWSVPKNAESGVQMVVGRDAGGEAEAQPGAPAEVQTVEPEEARVRDPGVDPGVDPVGARLEARLEAEDLVGVVVAGTRVPPALPPHSNKEGKSHHNPRSTRNPEKMTDSRSYRNFHSNPKDSFPCTFRRARYCIPPRRQPPPRLESGNEASSSSISRVQHNRKTLGALPRALLL